MTARRILGKIVKDSVCGLIWDSYFLGTALKGVRGSSCQFFGVARLVNSECEARLASTNKASFGLHINKASFGLRKDGRRKDEGEASEH